MEWLNLSILSSSRAVAANIHQWASHTMARASSHEPCFRSLKWSYIVWTLAWNLAWGSSQEVPTRVHLSSSSGCVGTHLHQRHSLTESRISQWRLSSISSSHGLILGDLCSCYMSCYISAISFLVDPGPMNSTADGSVPRSHSREGSHQSQQIAQSYSFLLGAAACKKIL